MPILLTFLAYALFCITAAALLAPGIHTILEAVGWSARPDRVIYRTAMVIAAVGLPVLLPRLELWGLAAAGLDRAPGDRYHGLWRDMRRSTLPGLGIGIVILGVLMIGLMTVGARIVSPAAAMGAGEFLRLLAVALLLGLVVGIIEEFMLRGVLQTGVRRTLGFWPTALLISLLYASLHFVRPGYYAGGDFDLAMSFELLGGILTKLGTIGDTLDSFVALALAGLLLSMVRERTGSLALCIGIHAGWVFVIKVGRKLTDVDPNGNGAAWIGNYDHITGWLAAGWLAVLCTAYWTLGPFSRSRARSRPPA